MARYLIRAAKQKDMVDLERIELKNFGHLYKKDASDWWIVRDASGAPVGFAGLKRLPREAGVGFLARCAVTRPARGQGLQRRLIKTREAAAKRAGLEWLITYTSHDNMASANNLIQCGFRLYVPDTYWGISRALYFRKRL